MRSDTQLRHNGQQGSSATAAGESCSVHRERQGDSLVHLTWMISAFNLPSTCALHNRQPRGAAARCSPALLEWPAPCRR